jgi:hypothetical protein
MKKHITETSRTGKSSVLPTSACTTTAEASTTKATKATSTEAPARASAKTTTEAAAKAAPKYRTGVRNCSATARSSKPGNDHQQEKDNCQNDDPFEGT